MRRIILVLSFALTACTAEKLDGGSTGNSKGAAGADIADAPLSGTIASKPFEPKAIEIYFDQRSEKWLLSIDNYEGDCGKITNRPPSDESMTVNVVGLENGTAWSVAQPTRYATLQLGVYQAAEGKKPDARN